MSSSHFLPSDTLRRVGRVITQLATTRLGDALTGTPAPSASAASPSSSSSAPFPAGEFRGLFLDAAEQESMDRAFAELAKPEYAPDANLATMEQRLDAYRRFVLFSRSGLLRAEDLEARPRRWLAASGAAMLFDFGLSAKMTIHQELFGTSVQRLGNRAQWEHFLPLINAAEVTGCFLMTECFHGSNVKLVGTTAHYDAATDELVIHTPNESARKMWAGNSYVGGRNTAVVFAQLYVGGTCHGVHAIVVELTNAQGERNRGVTILDLGEKTGWTAVDNGVISFDQVRVPRTNLLDRFGGITPAGQYSTNEPDDEKRFAAQLGALVFGRLLFSAGAATMMQLGLTIAVRYASRRKQFGPPTSDSAPNDPEARQAEEHTIMSYPLHQQKLMPMLAQTCAYSLVSRYATALYEREGASKHFHAVISGLKSRLGDWSFTSLTELRAACGGHGYASVNRLSTMVNDIMVFQTAEGEVSVMRQQTAAWLVSEFRRMYRHGSGPLKLLAGELRSLWDRNPITQQLSTAAHFRDVAFLHRALNYRVAKQLFSAVMDLMKYMRGVDPKKQPDAAFNAWNRVVPQLNVAVDSYVAAITMGQFRKTLDAISNPALRSRMKVACALFGVTELRDSMGFFVQHGFVGKAELVEEAFARLCAQLAKDAVAMVDAWGFPDHVVRAPIGLKSADYATAMINAANQLPAGEVLTKHRSML